MKVAKKYILILVFLFIGNLANSQAYLDGDKFKVGLKAGPAMSIIYGDALTKAYPGYGFTGGIYYRYHFKGGFHFQTELSATVHNSNYKNHEPNGYEKFSLFYIDAAQLLMIDLKKGSMQHCAIIGAQPSGLVESWVYNSYYQLSPAARGIKLNTMDVFAVVGYQYNKKIIGIQTSLKFGLTNINRGLNMHDDTGQKLGPTNDKGYLRNFTWETLISF